MHWRFQLRLVIDREKDLTLYQTSSAELTEMYQFEQIIGTDADYCQDKMSNWLIFSNKLELIVKSGVEHVGISGQSNLCTLGNIYCPVLKPPTFQFKSDFI